MALLVWLSERCSSSLRYLLCSSELCTAPASPRLNSCCSSLSLCSSSSSSPHLAFPDWGWGSTGCRMAGSGEGSLLFPAWSVDTLTPALSPDMDDEEGRYWDCVPFWSYVGRLWKEMQTKMFVSLLKRLQRKQLGERAHTSKGESCRLIAALPEHYRAASLTRTRHLPTHSASSSINHHSHAELCFYSH